MACCDPSLPEAADNQLDTLQGQEETRLTTERSQLLSMEAWTSYCRRLSMTVRLRPLDQTQQLQVVAAASRRIEFQRLGSCFVLTFKGSGKVYVAQPGHPSGWWLAT